MQADFIPQSNLWIKGYDDRSAKKVCRDLIKDMHIMSKTLVAVWQNKINKVRWNY